MGEYKIKTIITGATGMVGEGVLIECLRHPEVEQVLIINRKPVGMSHPKLREIIHTDFFNLAPIAQRDVVRVPTVVNKVELPGRA